MWYRFEEGNPIAIPRLEKYSVAWYDTSKGGQCFDEISYSPCEIGAVISYVETVEDAVKNDRSRVFAHFDNGDIYELKFELVEVG